MAIVRAGGQMGGQAGSGRAELSRHGAPEPAELKRAGAKKHAGKHAAKKSAGKKHAAKKQAGPADRRQPTVYSIADERSRMDDGQAGLATAFHHLQRAGAVISLLDPDTGGDLRALLEHGIGLYRQASGGEERSPRGVECASGLLRAAEHLGMAGLYAARKAYRVEVDVPTLRTVEHHLKTLGDRLEGVKPNDEGQRLLEMAHTLLDQARLARDDHHLRYELVMAADGICAALEAGL